jgi:aryl-alcohol dehydrogenase-like predicted oxidoreductase
MRLNESDAKPVSCGERIALARNVKTRTLGSSELLLTPIGLGTWAIGGGDWIFGWGPQQDTESLGTIRRALDEGVNWIDTAAAYGLGRAEVMVARAMDEMPRRERPYVFATCGLQWDDLGNVSHSFRPESIRREAEASLRRLGIECFDLYQLGSSVSPVSEPGDDAGLIDEAWDTLTRLQREGKARYIGLAGGNADQLERLHRIAPVTSVQAPYSLVRREIEDGMLRFCERHGVGVIAHSTVEAGLLTGKMTPSAVNALPYNDWRRWSPSFSEPMIHHALEVVERLRAVGARYARTPSQIAIAWALHNSALSAAAVGIRHPHQVAEIIGAASCFLSAKEIEELSAASHGVQVVGRYN